MRQVIRQRVKSRYEHYILQRSMRKYIGHLLKKVFEENNLEPGENVQMIWRGINYPGFIVKYDGYRVRLQFAINKH